MPGDSLRIGSSARRGVRDQRCHWRVGRLHTAPAAPAPPRGAGRERAPPGNPQPSPPSPRLVPFRAAAAATPGPALQNGGCSLFAAAAASIRPAGHRDRGYRLPPALRGEDPHRCSEGGRAKGARAKFSRLDPQRDPSSTFPHWTKWRPATAPPVHI